MLGLTSEPIDSSAVREAVCDPRHGAILVFEGVGRDGPPEQRVVHLSYEAYPELVAPVMQSIADEALDRFGAVVAMVHRTGVVGIGEASLVIAVGTPHRPECYEASRFVLEAIKARLPVWKKEIRSDGSEWKANAPAGESAGG